MKKRLNWKVLIILLIFIAGIFAVNSIYGASGVTCPNCGMDKYTKRWDERCVDVDCETDGKEVYRCDNRDAGCNRDEEIIVSYPQAYGHRFEDQGGNPTEIKYESAGEQTHNKLQYCDYCREWVVIGTSSHSTTWVEEYLPLDGSSHSMKIVCVCGYFYYEDEQCNITRGLWTTETPATCTTDEIQSRSCPDCGYTERISIQGTKLDHSFGEWIIDKPATYEEDGHKYRTCTICNTEKEEQTIPKLTEEEINISTTHTIKEIDNIKYIEIDTKINIQEFLKKIASTNSEIIIKDKDGNELNSSSNVGTGAKVITKANGEEQYTVILKGDIDSDGEVSFRDIIRANAVRIANSESSIIKAQLLAADIDSSNKIEFRDIIKLNAIRINSGN